MITKEISAEPLEKVWVDVKNLTQEELCQIDVQMRHIETYETFLAIEWGYRFYIGCLPDEKGIKGYQKIGFDTEAEWIKSFKSTTRRTAYNKRKVYELWAKYLYDLPTTTFFEVGYSKILAIRHEIVKHAGDKQKLTELVEEAAALFRHQLLQKYHDRPLRLYWRGTFESTADGKVIISDFESKLDISDLCVLNGKKLKGVFELAEEEWE